MLPPFKQLVSLDVLLNVNFSWWMKFALAEKRRKKTCITDSVPQGSAEEESHSNNIKVVNYSSVKSTQ